MNNNTPIIGYDHHPHYVVLKTTISEQMIDKFADNSARYNATAVIISRIMDRK